MYLKRQRGTNGFLWISESHLGSAYVCPFGSEVMVTRLNRRKERVNTMTGVSHFVYVASLHSRSYFLRAQRTVRRSLLVACRRVGGEWSDRGLGVRARVLDGRM